MVGGAKTKRIAGFSTAALGVLMAMASSQAQTPAEFGPPRPSAAVMRASVATPATEAGLEAQIIRQVADSAAKYFNAGDAAGFASLFADGGEMVDAAGNRVIGRQRIEQTFRQLFAARPGDHMDIMIDSVRLLSPTVALEEGSSTVTDARDRSVDRNRYSIVHVKQSDGRWLIESTRDFTDQAAIAQHSLEDLGWLVGEWVDETPGAVVQTDYAWTENRTYLVSEFKAQVNGRVTLSGSQRIGWDPRENKLRSWVFDSDGGFAEGTWTRNGESWIIKLEGVSRDGSPASATQIIKRLSGDRYSWQSRDRIVGDDVKSNSGESLVVRRAPGPSMRELPHR